MKIVDSILIGLASAVLIVSNTILYTIAKKHYVEISKLQKHCLGTRKENGREQTEDCLSSSSNTKQRVVLKSMYVCVCVVMSFVVAWFPYFVRNILYLHGGFSAISDEFAHIAEMFALLNLIMDPLLFVFFRRDVKMMFKKFLRPYQEQSPEIFIPRTHTVCKTNEM